MVRKSISQYLTTTERQYIETGTIIESNVPYTKVSLSRLTPWKSQPRRYFSEEALQQLAHSISLEGLKHPLLVRPRGEDYEVIAGERRYRAALLAQLESVPCLIRELTDEEAFSASLDENLSREDLNPIEILDSLLKLLSLRLEQTESEVCQLLKNMRSAWTHREEDTPSRDINIPNPDDHLQVTVKKEFEQYGYNWYSFACNQLKLRDLPEDVYDAIASGKIEYSKGLRFKVIFDPQERNHLLQEAINSGWTQKDIGEKIKQWQATKVKSLKKNLTPTQRVKQLSDRIKSQNWRERPELLSQLEKKLAILEKWLDENLEES